MDQKRVLQFLGDELRRVQRPSSPDLGSVTGGLFREFLRSAVPDAQKGIPIIPSAKKKIPIIYTVTH